MGELYVLNHEGDTRIKWNPNNKDEVESAKNQFEFFKKKGFTAFDDQKNEKITKFDPDLEKVIFVPKIAGG